MVYTPAEVWALTPVRLFRQRTAVNLVVSYVAMALITISLLGLILNGLLQGLRS